MSIAGLLLLREGDKDQRKGRVPACCTADHRKAVGDIIISQGIEIFCLEQWGLWAYHNRGLSINWSSIEPYITESSAPNPQIGDATGCLIDRMVSELCVEFPDEGSAVCLYYLAAPSYQRVSKAMGIDRGKATSLVRSGRMWVAGRLKELGGV